jgi:hypothetical protein
MLFFQWNPPKDDGACPVLGYVLYLDDGTNTGAFAPIDEDQIANKNYLRTHKVTFLPGDEGKTFRYILEVRNEIGST